MKALNLIECELGSYAGGMNLIVVICIAIFFALYLLAGILADLFWSPLTVPFAWVDENRDWVFLGAQVIVVLLLISYSQSKWKLIFSIPLYVVSFTAIILLLQGLILGFIVAAGAFLSLAAAAGSEGGTKELTQTEKWAKAEREERERHYLWNLYNKKD